MIKWLRMSVFELPPNDRGYGHLAVCGRISCRETTKEMRAQNPLSARQPACEHRRVLCGRSLVFSISSWLKSLISKVV